ncbi:MAG: EF-hand domain-containing protein [Candidatus Sericytochromatia bacterium]|nr:EF-hand domain-containing protein [Candidatus Sericytochromatia bacterium]
MRLFRGAGVVLVAVSLCACTTPIVITPLPLGAAALGGAGAGGDVPSPSPGQPPDSPRPSVRPTGVAPDGVAPASPSAVPAPSEAPLASAAPPATSPEPGPTEAPAAPPACPEAFQRLDLNRDRALEPAEVETPERFAALDRNGDGLVVATEFCNGPAEFDGNIPCEVHFRRADLDADGIVTQDEAITLDRQQAGRSNGPFYFDFLRKNDLDKDGMITVAEGCEGVFPPTGDACGDRFHRASGMAPLLPLAQANLLGWTPEEATMRDLSLDRHIDRQEYGWASCGEAMPPDADPCERTFQATAGEDGLVSPAEADRFAWQPGRHAAADTSGDGLLDQQEFCRSMRMDRPPQGCVYQFGTFAGNDEQIDADEAASHGLTVALRVIDFDRDGKISRLEFSNFLCWGPPAR